VDRLLGISDITTPNIVVGMNKKISLDKYKQHAKTVKNTENTDGQKNEIQRKIRIIIIVGLRLVLSKNCILKIRVQMGLYFTVFFKYNGQMSVLACTETNSSLFAKQSMMAFNRCN
jgi:hypothetical protein